MGHRNKERIDFSNFKRMEALKLPANRDEWFPAHRQNDCLEIYLSETMDHKKNFLTVVGVNDGDDGYIVKWFDGHDNPDAFELFTRLMNMEIIFKKNLYDLGMYDD
ncbi:MAG: hypothetical protein M0R77_20585 [Gammaproteobacteria bacterium]|nr:hypothetical protein [Gammaproteobacteria bacterium]